MPLVVNPRHRAVLSKALLVGSIFYVLVFLSWLTEDLHGVRVASAAAKPFSNGLHHLKQHVWETGACDKWDPTAPASADPPNCLRATQYREFQAYHASGAYGKLDNANRKALLDAERCVLGITKCAERPIIVVDYFYWNTASRATQGPGEVVWGWPIVSPPPKQRQS